MAEGRSRSLLRPVVSALALIAVIILVIAFRSQVWEATKWTFRTVGDWFTNWVPNHPGESIVLLAFALLAFAVNWIAHVRGRLRAWIFAIVLELGLWLLFWYGAGIPPLYELFGIDLKPADMGGATAVLFSGILVVAITGVIFWFLEAREEWRKYRHRHSTGDD
jgi:hypothetical protein